MLEDYEDLYLQSITLAALGKCQITIHPPTSALQCRPIPSRPFCNCVEHLDNSSVRNPGTRRLESGLLEHLFRWLYLYALIDVIVTFLFGGYDLV